MKGGRIFGGGLSHQLVLQIVMLNPALGYGFVYRIMQECAFTGVLFFGMAQAELTFTVAEKSTKA